MINRIWTIRHWSEIPNEWKISSVIIVILIYFLSLILEKNLKTINIKSEKLENIYIYIVVGSSVGFIILIYLCYWINKI